MKKVFCILLVGLLLFVTGCREIETYVESEFSTFEDTDVTTTQRKTTATVTYPDVPFPSFEEDVVFYAVDLASFQMFLENPSYGIIYAEGERFKAVAEDGYHPASVGDRALILQEVIDFVGSKEALTAFLSQKGVQVDVQGAVLMDASYVPLTIFIKTAQTPVFITVNEDTEQHKTPYEYKAYTYAQYREKYRQQSGKLIVKGKDITEEGFVKLYYENAHVSLLPVLKAVGVTAKETAYGDWKITYQGKTHILYWSRKQFKPESGGDNILWVDGGFESAYVYHENGEFMVSDFLIDEVLYAIGSECRATVDMETKAVIVK